jgi:hypothetical protein
MRRAILIGLAFGMVCLAAPAFAAPQPSDLCAALAALTAQAKATGQPQRISLDKEDPEEILCSHTPGDSVQEAFCDAVTSNVGLEAMHSYPWQIKWCLPRGVRPLTEEGKGYTGLQMPKLFGRVNMKKIVHLSASLPDDVRIDLRYITSDPSFADGWYGHYDLVIWTPATPPS